MAITLGKDTTITVGGSIASVRNVTLQATARTIDVDAYGSRLAEVYSTGRELAVSFEFLDSADLSFIDFLNGTTVMVAAGAGSWSFPAVITSITETDPIDGVATFQVEARLTRAGLKL